MEELLNKVAELRGMPASLVKRSAEARAESTGASVEDVLRDWAGEAGEAASSETAESEPAAPEEPSTQDAPPSEKAEKKAGTSVPAEVTLDYLIQLAADAKRMPTKLILTSAQARATHSGASVESVLAGWAGVNLEDLKAEAATKTAEASAEGEAEPVARTVATETDGDEAVPPRQVDPVSTAAAGATIGMDELLEKVAEAKGMPASLAKRSADARAKKTGESVESVLAEWAGIDPATVSTDPVQAAAAPTSPPEPQIVAPAPGAEAESTDDIEIIEASKPTPTDAAANEAEEQEDGGVPAGRYPRWLAAAFVVIPLLAVMFILVSPNGPDCGTSAQLHIDPVSGEAVNCDGSAYGTDVVDHFGDGAAVYAQCQACHNADGSGGAGPAFASGAVLATFPAGSCDEHIEWISLGTAGWPDATYGATGKPVGGFGLMPSFGPTLSLQQIADVALYERVQFGGQSLADAELDCAVPEEVQAAG
jgi:mono/diheme cytochrome c family protein